MLAEYYAYNANLKTISFKGNNIKNISPLVHLSSLKKLILDKTAVDNILPLSKLKELKYLSVCYTKVTESQIKELKKSLPECDIYHDFE